MGRKSNLLTDNIASAGGEDMVQDQADAEEELSTKDERNKQLGSTSRGQHSTEIVVTNWETSLPLRLSL